VPVIMPPGFARLFAHPLATFRRKITKSGAARR
jgi:hypothetical protein